MSKTSNVLKLKKLIKNKFDSVETINIISSPIYSRRLDMLFRKNIDIKKIFLEPSRSYEEEKNFDYFSLIYELFSIIYLQRILSMKTLIFSSSFWNIYNFIFDLKRNFKKRNL